MKFVLVTWLYTTDNIINKQSVIQGRSLIGACVLFRHKSPYIRKHCFLNDINVKFVQNNLIYVVCELSVRVIRKSDNHRFWCKSLGSKMSELYRRTESFYYALRKGTTCSDCKNSVLVAITTAKAAVEAMTLQTFFSIIKDNFINLVNISAAWSYVGLPKF